MEDLYLMHDAYIRKSYSALTKSEKIYMQNTNLIYAITKKMGNKGRCREIFFAKQLAAKHSVHFAKQGDFLRDDSLVFEIGGAQKIFTQIADVKNSYLAIDEVQIGRGNKIPLWLFGFLN